jgi:hypothetical protein
MFDVQAQALPQNQGDGSYYLTTGNNIIQHGVHSSGSPKLPDAKRPPLYSAFAGLLASSPFNLAYAFFITQSAISILGALILYLIMVPTHPRLAFISALLVAGSPFEAVINIRVLSENIAPTLWLLALALLVFVRHRRIAIFASGLLSGVACLIFAPSLLFPVCVAGVMMLVKPLRRSVWVYGIGVILVVTPWVARNASMEDGGYYISQPGNHWRNLWIGTWSTGSKWMTHAFSTQDLRLPAEAYAFPVDDPYAKIKAYSCWKDITSPYCERLVKRKIKEQPIDLLKTWVIRFPTLWAGASRSEMAITRAEHGTWEWKLVKSSFFGLNIVFLALGIAGMIIAYRRYRFLLLFAIPVVYTSIIFFPLHNSETRYSIPAYPSVLIFAALTLITLMDYWHKKR